MSIVMQAGQILSDDIDMEGDQVTSPTEASSARETRKQREEYELAKSKRLHETFNPGSCYCHCVLPETADSPASRLPGPSVATEEH
jgi:hypothetical protein